jgi:hypothetical protein
MKLPKKNSRKYGSTKTVTVTGRRKRWAEDNLTPDFDIQYDPFVSVSQTRDSFCIYIIVHLK